MTFSKMLAAAVAAATMSFTVAACGDGGGEPASPEQTAANGAVFNDADVDFATSMIPHHAQALAMVDLTRGRHLSPQVRRLAEEIQAAQGPEIELMTDWLNAWDKPVPETMRDHVHAEDSDGMDGHGGQDMHDMGGDASSDMPGMMSDQDMADLQAARGPEFEHRWLELMIEHHRGAIEMAEKEQEDGAYRPAIRLAEQIDASQQAEIDQMKKLLGN